MFPCILNHELFHFSQTPPPHQEYLHFRAEFALYASNLISRYNTVALPKNAVGGPMQFYVSKLCLLFESQKSAPLM